MIVHLRCQEGREKLLFAANPAAPRLHLTAASPENPAQPPMFCMLLRKHLLGAKLTEVSQPPMERAASFRFDCTDEMGFPVQKTLVAELMGRTWVKDMEHVNFGMVSMEEGTLSTRHGNVVYLEDVLHASMEKTLEIIKEKSPESSG